MRTQQHEMDYTSSPCLGDKDKPIGWRFQIAFTQFRITTASRWNELKNGKFSKHLNSVVKCTHHEADNNHITDVNRILREVVAHFLGNYNYIYQFTSECSKGDPLRCRTAERNSTRIQKVTSNQNLGVSSTKYSMWPNEKHCLTPSASTKFIYGIKYTGLFWQPKDL